MTANLVQIPPDRMWPADRPATTGGEGGAATRYFSLAQGFIRFRQDRLDTRDNRAFPGASVACRHVIPGRGRRILSLAAGG